jgi:hypothetical protein
VQPFNKINDIRIKTLIRLIHSSQLIKII